LFPCPGDRRSRWAVPLSSLYRGRREEGGRRKRERDGREKGERWERDGREMGERWEGDGREEEDT
jgi:hypothetical protein